MANCTESTRGAGGLVRFLAIVGLLAASVVVSPAPAGAETTVDARAAALSASASCSTGDIEITYAGSGIERQITDFSAANGTTLHHYDVAAFADTFDGVEYILSQTSSPPAPGTLLYVYVTIGTSPPDANTGEFFVAYRCDSARNSAGGNNVVVATCAGPYGSCPRSVSDPAAPQRAVPQFTG